eukprot:1160888-Pelagomonas_calceolata.AAC.7
MTRLEGGHPEKGSVQKERCLGRRCSCLFATQETHGFCACSPNIHMSAWSKERAAQELLTSEV